MFQKVYGEDSIMNKLRVQLRCEGECEYDCQGYSEA